MLPLTSEVEDESARSKGFGQLNTCCCLHRLRLNLRILSACVLPDATADHHVWLRVGRNTLPYKYYVVWTVHAAVGSCSCDIAPIALCWSINVFIKDTDYPTMNISELSMVIFYIIALLLYNQSSPQPNVILAFVAQRIERDGVHRTRVRAPLPRACDDLGDQLVHRRSVVAGH